MVLVLAAVLLAMCSSVHADSVADFKIVTLAVDAPGKQMYHLLLDCWIRQLMAMDYPPSRLLVLGAGDQWLSRAVAHRHGVPWKDVPLLTSAVTVDKSYAHQVTKLHVFDLDVPFVYYDTDFVFNMDPVECFRACPPNRLCAAEDLYQLIGRPKGYFNAGLLVAWPGTVPKEDLLSLARRLGPQTFAEQDVLNTWARGKVALLPPSCNTFPGTPTDPLTGRINFHAKLFRYPTTMWPSACRR
jgi:hypothetical protein